MDTSLRRFISQFAGVLLAALAPVVLITFLWIPFAIGGHPGEARPHNPMLERHLT